MFTYPHAQSILAWYIAKGDTMSLRRERIDWEHHIVMQKKSGLSVQAYSQREGFSSLSFFRIPTVNGVFRSSLQWSMLFDDGRVYRIDPVHRQKIFDITGITFGEFFKNMGAPLVTLLIYLQLRLFETSFDNNSLIYVHYISNLAPKNRLNSLNFAIYCM